MATVKVVLRKKKNKDGTYPLAIRITKDGRSSYVYTGQSIKENEWDSAQHRVRKSHPNSTRLNYFLITKLAEANEKYLQLEIDRGSVLPELVRSALKPLGNGSSFFSIAKVYLDNFLKAGKYNRYYPDQSRVNNFKEFLDKRDIAFQDITLPLLNRFKSHLKEKKLSDRSVANHLIIIRTIFNLAVKSNVVEQKYYPFGKEKVKIKLPESIKIGLTAQEVNKIEELQLEKGSYTQHSKNIWLFSFYLAGMRVSDVLRLKWRDIQDNRLSYSMGKNSKIGSLKLSVKVNSILDQYKKQKHSDFVFPDLQNVNSDDPFELQRKISYSVKRINKHLEKIKEKIELDKKLTMHIARHTFGNISGDKISIQMLQKLYRHSSITTTIGYQANFIHKDADDALAAVVGV